MQKGVMTMLLASIFVLFGIGIIIVERINLFNKKIELITSKISFNYEILSPNFLINALALLCIVGGGLVLISSARKTE
ncbi:hypothetical protein HNQ04_004212 [Deinococcus radiopugnans ATCC 19172]|uniref:NADH-quinone oxidoreductase subunit J n=2 Tax=Deinococcus radiopugnans TaxID=57497 RepID=A0ABR6NY05_9DEIO|nr:hypothetical protein [Deinococcus radiopugnans ATCC 19172]